MEEKENKIEKKTFKEIIKRYKVWLGIAAVLVIVVSVFLGVKLSESGQITLISESSLKEVVQSQDISTLQYIYNSMTAVRNEKGKEKYHVSYEGEIKIGFNLEEISVVNDGMKIVVTIPEMEIQSVNVKMESLDFIFIKEKYETETVAQEAYSACVEDLQKKAAENGTLFGLARENAIDIMCALLKPWEDQLAEGYTVEIR